ncbi:DUF2459 domain-containing protein [Roseomonas sp. HF4]|uniref:DUF2459 domain-containing protein n=1 Tax=Roseomonas sp. HF4 TaxID=2562313 RepID=UPI001484F414|nr:DUF2459 domain-containing protein [Roseomonas sp. HF4]
MAAASLAAPAMGCAMADPAPISDLGPVPQGSIPLTLVSREWHTDIGVPVHMLDAPTREDWLNAVPRRDWSEIVPRDGRITFGFGAKVFMTAAAPGVEEALAALMNAPGVVAVSGQPARPEDLGEIDDLAEVKVTPEGLGRMLRFVRQQVERDAAGRPSLLGGFFRGRKLFDSRLRYNTDFTCNTWTLQALQAAGLPVRPDGVVWSRQVMRQVRRVAEHQAAA